jgi:hypothetical protein
MRYYHDKDILLVCEYDLTDEQWFEQLQAVRPMMTWEEFQVYSCPLWEREASSFCLH